MGVEDVEGGENKVPLLRQQHKNVRGASEENGYGGAENDDQLLSTHENGKKEELWMVYLSTFVAACGSFSFGSCTGYSSPTQAAIREDLNLSLAQYSVFGSILTFGAMFGGITSGPIADFIGRKRAMGMSSCICLAGWLAIYFAKGAVCLDIGRLTTGYSIGVFSYVVPVFITEIAPKDLRGALTILNLLMLGVGTFVAFTIGIVLSWRTLALTGLIPCVIMLLGLFFIPESPRWLAKKGNHKEFVAALQKLRGKDVDISDEAAEIQDYTESLQQLPKAKVLDLFQRRYSRSLIIGIGIMIFQQFGGINGVGFYLDTIFESVGFSTSVGSIGYVSLQLLFGLLSTAVVDKAGRKPLLLVSATGITIGCLLTAISFYLKAHDLFLNLVPILAVTGIMVFIASYATGMGGIPWVIMSEVFPINIKGVAGSLATLVNWFSAWVVSYTFNYLLTWSFYGTFILYAAINALTIVFVLKIVPETKGKTLEEIQASITCIY